MEVNTAGKMDVYIRNYVLSVLCTYQEKGINLGNIATMATDITKAVIDATEKWHKMRLCDLVETLTDGGKR